MLICVRQILGFRKTIGDNFINPWSSVKVTLSLIFWLQDGWVGNTILSIENQTENVLEMNSSNVDLKYRTKREITLDPDTLIQTSRKKPTPILERPKRHIKILCPGQLDKVYFIK